MEVISGPTKVAGIMQISPFAVEILQVSLITLKFRSGDTYKIIKIENHIKRFEYLISS